MLGDKEFWDVVMMKSAWLSAESVHKINYQVEGCSSIEEVVARGRNFSG